MVGGASGSDPVDLQSGDFAGLTRLAYLFAGSARIRTLPAGIFSDTANIGSIDLSGNMLASLDEATFASLPKLRLLNLSNQ